MKQVITDLLALGFLIILCIIFVSIAFNSGEEQPDRDYRYKVEIEYCSGRQNDTIEVVSNDENIGYISTYKQAVPIFVIWNHDNILNVCSYQIISKDSIQ